MIKACLAAIVLCSIAAPGFAAAGPLAVQDAGADRRESESAGPVACVDSGIRRAYDRAAIVALLQSSERPRTATDRTLAWAISGAASQCKAQYGWGEAREAAAMQYLMGSSLRRAAADALEAYKVRSYYFDAGLAALSESDRERLTAESTVSPAAMTVAARAIEAEGAAFGTPESEELRRIGAALGQGLIGTLLMQRAALAYRGA